MNNTTTQQPQFYAVIDMITSDAPGGNVGQLFDQLGPDLFDMQVALACERLGIDYDAFDAWWINNSTHGIPGKV